MDREEVLIRYYFQRGFDYSVILLFLEKYHPTEMSMRTLHNRPRDYGLRRRNANSDDAGIYQAIQQELDGPGTPFVCGTPFVWITEYRHQEGRSKGLYNNLTLKEQPYGRLMY